MLTAFQFTKILQLNQPPKIIFHNELPVAALAWLPVACCKISDSSSSEAGLKAYKLRSSFFVMKYQDCQVHKSCTKYWYALEPLDQEMNDTLWSQRGVIFTDVVKKHEYTD